MRTGKNKHFISICLLVLYLVFQAGISVFTHVHILNGEKLVHSHPYSNANHTHTSDQAIAIARLSSAQTLKAETAVFREVHLPMLYALTFNTDSFSTKVPHAHCVSLRAPPFC